LAKIPERRSAKKAVSTFTWRSALLCQAFALGVSPLLPLSAMAQTAGTTGTTTTTPQTVGGTTILPTDVVPLADREAYKTPIGELLQLKIMQRLPSNLYFSSSVEITGRDETNPFQFPTKRALLAQLPRPAIWRTLNGNQQAGLYDILGKVARNNAIFRILPNVSGGWAFTPHTRLFTNYFMIRDQLSHNNVLNTVIHSYAIGVQHDWPLGSKGSLQAEVQGRELWQLHQPSVFDFLPGVTLSYIVNPRTVAFVNALMQIRGKNVFIGNGSMRELDPFFTWGGLYQKNGWTFSASSTFVQNFREPFHHNASVPKNSYVMISDFEIARRIMKQYPGLQAFMRAEPIWNFHAHNTPSLSGMDFRMFFGMRFAMAKPPLTATLQQIREQLKQETVPEGPATKPSAELPTEPEIAMNPQPIHGFIESSTLAETCQLPDGEMPVIAEDESGDESAANNMIAQESGAAANQPEANAKSQMNTELADASTAVNTAADAVIADAKDEAPAETPVATASASVSAEKEPPTIADAGLKALSEKTEQDYKVAFSSLPVPLPIPSSAPLASPAPALKALPAAPLPSSASHQIAAPAAAMKALPPASLPVPAKGGLTAIKAPVSSIPVAPPSSASTNSTMAFIYVPPKPMMPKMDSAAANKLMQPLQQKTARSHTAELPPTALKASEKKGSMTSPVPVLAKMQPVAPNAVPSPVSAKLAKPLGILPSVSGEKASAESTVASEKTAPVKHLTNKDGSIAISEAKMDTFESGSKSGTARPATVAKAAEAPQKIASLPASTNQIQQTVVEDSHQNSARENEMLLASNKITKLVNNPLASNPFRAQTNPLSLPVIRSSSASPAASAPSSVKSAAPQLSLKTPIIPAVPAPVPDGESNPNAVSGLSEEEISSSPKIAMAVYDSWQSPVLDEPLIEDASAKARKSHGSSSYDSSAALQQKQHAKPEKKRTDMKLIPPFPTATKESKDSPLKDLKIPVLPVR
jgi:hypothetical protein